MGENGDRSLRKGVLAFSGSGFSGDLKVLEGSGSFDSFNFLDLFDLLSCLVDIIN